MSRSCWKNSEILFNLLSLTGMERAFLFLFILIGFIAPSHAAFQENLWGARPAGMAGAFTALADDANAPNYNPAGISFIKSNELTMMYAQLFSGLDLHAGDESSKLGMGYFSFVPRIQNNRYGNFGVSWTNFTASNVLREDSFILTYANSFQIHSAETQPIFSYGTNLKYLKHSFSADQYSASDPVFKNGSSARAVTVDLGLMARPHFMVLPGLKFGLAAQNITQPNVGLLGADRVPARYTVGIAYQDLRYRLFNPAMDISRRAGRTLVSLAWEGWMVHDTIAMRLGGNHDELGGGFGYQFRLGDKMSIRLDYSILWPLDVAQTNGNHRVSLTTNF